MQKYIGAHAKINTMLFSLKKETKTSSKIVYPDVMEATVHSQLNPITMFEDTIALYKYSHCYVTKYLQVEVIGKDFHQNQAWYVILSYYTCFIRIYPFLSLMGICHIVFEIDL